MIALYHFIMGWKDLIAGVFGEYPLAASLLTLVAIGLFYQLDTQWRPHKRSTNLLLTLGGWSVTVPIVGTALKIVSTVLESIEKAIPILAKLVESLYGIYSHHPFIVLAIWGLGFVGYFVWKIWRPRVLPYRTARIVALAGAAVLVTFIVGTIADIFVPPEETGLAEDKAKTLAKPSPPAASTQPATQPAAATASPVSGPSQ